MTLLDHPTWAARAAGLSPQGGVYIDGGFRAARSGRTFASVDPGTEALIAEVAAGDGPDVDDAAASARRAFEAGAWSRAAPADRKGVLLRLVALMHEHAHELALLDSLDNRDAVTAQAGARLAAVPAMRFTLRQLEYFVAAADAGSVTDAAQNIPVAQSSVSAAIAQLEAALGVQLLIRHHAQGISPTAEGRQFLARARALLHDADELERFASELTAELTGTLHLGCLVTLAPLITPRLGQGFRERHPAARLEMVEAGQADLVAGLRAGRLSVALTYDLDLSNDLAFAPMASLPPRALLAADHPLAAKESVTLGDLAGEPLVLLDLPHSRDYFHALFAAAGAEPTVAHRSIHPEVIRTMVANDFGYSIINARPHIDVALDGRPLVTRPIAGDPRPMIMGLARLESLRPTRLVEAFEQHCRAAIAAGTVPGLGDDAAREAASA